MDEDEDEKTAALEWARGEIEPMGYGLMARALLDAVRLICEGEWDATDHCPKCFEPTYANHTADCSVGQWVRAATKVGL